MVLRHEQWSGSGNAPEVPVLNAGRVPKVRACALSFLERQAQGKLDFPWGISGGQLSEPSEVGASKERGLSRQSFSMVTLNTSVRNWIVFSLPSPMFWKSDASRGRVSGPHNWLLRSVPSVPGDCAGKVSTLKYRATAG